MWIQGKALLCQPKYCYYTKANGNKKLKKMNKLIEKSPFLWKPDI